MEKKEYEIGYVEITTQEYKDLIAEAVEHRKDAERYLLEKCRVEGENKELKGELFETQKRVVELEAMLADASWAEYQSTPTRYGMECTSTCSTEVANNG